MKVRIDMEERDGKQANTNTQDPVVSMIDPEFLEKLEFIGRSIRKSVKPFGGIQIIMTGDFFQLPPVNKTNAATRYAFDAKCWHDIAEEKINLTQVFRQKDPGTKPLRGSSPLHKIGFCG